MVTNMVGIRDLKSHAPRLVQRAARGERIVIARYGKPLAMLGPPEGPGIGAPAGRMAEWARERDWFERNQSALERRYAGRYVAVRRGRVLDADEDPEALYQRVWRSVRGATIFVGRVGGGGALVEMPSFETR